MTFIDWILNKLRKNDKCESNLVQERLYIEVEEPPLDMEFDKDNEDDENNRNNRVIIIDI